MSRLVLSRPSVDVGIGKSAPSDSAKKYGERGAAPVHDTPSSRSVCAAAPPT
jgi:hypothetical protein